MSHTVIGIFKNSSEAGRTVDHLLENGFERSQIDTSKDYSREDYNKVSSEHSSGISNFFQSLFGSGDDADRHTEASRRGVVVTVHSRSKDEAIRASEILDSYGTLDLSDRDTTDTHRSADTTSERRGTAGTFTTGQVNKERDTSTHKSHESETSKDSIPVVEENVQAGKRSEETGKVRVRSRIIERPVEEHLRLRDENVHVERNPVDRKATKEDLANAENKDIEMTEHKEKPVVNKESRVVEEVNLKKDVSERDKTIREKARKTAVEVDKSDERRRKERIRENEK